MTFTQIKAGAKILLALLLLGLVTLCLCIYLEPVVWRISVWLSELLSAGVGVGRAEADLELVDLAPEEGQMFADSFRALRPADDAWPPPGLISSAKGRAWVCIVRTAMGPIPADLPEADYRARFSAAVDRLYPPSPVSLES